MGKLEGAERMLIWEKRQLWSGRADGVGINPGVLGVKLPRAGENKIAFVREKTKASGVRKIGTKKVGAMEESDTFYTKVSSGKKNKT